MWRISPHDRFVGARDDKYEVCSSPTAPPLVGPPSAHSYFRLPQNLHSCRQSELTLQICLNQLAKHDLDATSRRKTEILLKLWESNGNNAEKIEQNNVGFPRSNVV